MILESAIVVVYQKSHRVPGEWLVPLPHSLTLKESMIIGTAGFTATLAIDALEAHGLTPSQTVLITGATGGVGSPALAMLKAKGYQNLTAVSRKQVTTLIPTFRNKVLVQFSHQMI